MPKTIKSNNDVMNTPKSPLIKGLLVDSEKNHSSTSWLNSISSYFCRNESSNELPYILNIDEIHEVLYFLIKEYQQISLDEDTLSIISEYAITEMQWQVGCGDYKIAPHGLTIENESQNSSNWNTWAYTDAFPETGVSELRVRIDKKRSDSGWLGLGVIRKSFVERSDPSDGGYAVYNKHCMFIDPSWYLNESHFNLKNLDVKKQQQMKEGDEITMVVNNNTKELSFYLNDERKSFAQGNWKKFNYEPLCGYAILTSNGDQFSIVQNKNVRKNKSPARSLSFPTVKTVKTI
eukprot:UN24698